MKKFRILAASAALSLALLGGAGSAANAQGITPDTSFTGCFQDMALEGELGTHLSGMTDGTSTVGEHIYTMLTHPHDCQMTIEPMS